ncbi:malonyl CoA-acyl carrier protein transacylase [Helicobacter enhydrae]|uniref:Malonyl CoA-acyl carrier protein transacylase n=1 Tax=Helicobacter enhydrae TaxID=222136 RepID=A0A1B1U537_9HELI|nr:ACP S-malonyltransferase [Helicobacter enhydrae]ANV97907.1 malonyl CoA-acyl carrier protein transacylase [Helicobacter enhydrae]
MKLAFIFPGQGSQSIGMGQDFFQNFSIAKELFECASDTLGLNMQNLLFEENPQINLTQYTQPAIFLVSAIAHHILQEESNLSPLIALGHSLGEVSAVALANAMSFEDAIALTHKRGLLMSEVCADKEAGMMVVMGLEDHQLEEFCLSQREEGKEIWCANYNGEGQVVIAGKKADLLSCESSFKALGAKRALLLPISIASHCPLLEGMCQDFQILLQETITNDFSHQILSNATLQPYTTKQEAIPLLTQQLTMPVLYKQSIQKVAQEVEMFIEFGNGNVLKGLNRRITDKPTLTISDTASLKECLQQLNTKESL